MKDYIQQAANTKTGLKVQIGTHNEDLLHGAIGLSTEANELLSALKAHLFYGKPLDAVNMMEELGDCFWFMSLLADYFNVTFEELMEMNINKLKIRYPHKFEQDKAINRSYENERKAFEK